MCSANHKPAVVWFCMWGDARNSSERSALIAPILQREKLTRRDIQRLLKVNWLVMADLGSEPYEASDFADLPTWKTQSWLKDVGRRG